MQTIYLDISNKGVVPCIMAKQSEVGRKFLAVITDNGVPYNIPDNSLLSVWYEGETDAGNYSSIEDRSAFSIDGNKVTVELVAQMLLKPGSGDLCLSVTHGDGGETNTWNIPYRVEYKPGAGSSVPTEYYTALQESASLAAASAAIAQNAAADAEEALHNTLPLDGSRSMEADLQMAGHGIKGVKAPESDNDAVNKSYVDKGFVPVQRVLNSQLGQYDYIACHLTPNGTGGIHALCTTLFEIEGSDGQYYFYYATHLITGHSHFGFFVTPLADHVTNNSDVIPDDLHSFELQEAYVDGVGTIGLQFKNMSTYTAKCSVSCVPICGEITHMA